MPVDPNYKGGLPDLLGWGAGVTSRDHADNPYGPNALQIGGIDPAQLAVAVLKSIINHPGTNPSLGPDPFNSPNPADRQGPNGGSPFSYGPQPYNPLNNDERHHGGGDSNADSGGTYTPSNGVTGEGRGGGPVSGPDRALGGPKSDSGGDGGDSFADHDRSPSPSGGSPGPTGGQGSNYSPSSGHSTPSSPNKPSGGTPSPRSSGATGSVHDPKHTNGTNFGGPRPIVLDIAGTGIAINELTNSNKFFDAEGTGLLHRTAWAGVGSGVLFYDAGNDGVITEKREYVFTEWDPTARGDLEAIRSVFDTNGDGVLNASDAEFSKFKVEVTLANGTTEVKTLTELGITSINLKADLTNIQYADGSAITGQTTFTRSNGTTGTVANAVLAAEATGYAVTNTSTVDAAGTRTTINVALASDGSVASSTKTVTTATGGSVTSFDNNGDGVYDRVQTKTVSSASGVKTEVITNRDGGNVLIDSTNTVTQTSAGVKTVTISRDESGGNYITQREVQTTAVDGSRTIAISDLNADGSVIRSETTGLNVTGLTRTVSTNMDNDAFNDRITTHTLTHVANVSSKETTIVMANNETVLGKAFDMMVINHFSTSSQANDNQFPALQRVA